MLTFILKALVVTVCATGGYLVALKYSMKYAMKFIEKYAEMLNA